MNHDHEREVGAERVRDGHKDAHSRVAEERAISPLANLRGDPFRPTGLFRAIRENAECERNAPDERVVGANDLPKQLSFFFEARGVPREQLNSPQGNELRQAVRRYAVKPLPDHEVDRIAGKHLSTFREMPEFSKHNELLKVVPIGQKADVEGREKTAYFMTRQQWHPLEKDPESIADRLALPPRSEQRALIAGGCDIYRIVPTEPNKPCSGLCLSATAAIATQHEVIRNGGAHQVFVLDRSQWTEPEHHACLRFGTVQKAT
jgi:hypothetical protein